MWPWDVQVLTSNTVKNGNAVTFESFYAHQMLFCSLLFESLHDTRPMLGAESSSEVELFQVFMGTRLWQDGADQQVFHGLFIPTFARCLSILVESSFLHKGFASSSSYRSGCDLGLTRCAMYHSKLVVAILWDWMRAWLQQIQDTAAPRMC